MIEDEAWKKNFGVEKIKRHINGLEVLGCFAQDRVKVCYLDLDLHKGSSASAFLCPHCHEMRATVNPRNNLAHCFCCNKNINNIDLLMRLDYGFRDAIALLERFLNEHQAKQTKGNRPVDTDSLARVSAPLGGRGFGRSLAA